VVAGGRRARVFTLAASRSPPTDSHLRRSRKERRTFGVNEKTQTQTVAGPRPVQRDAGPQGRSEREKEIASLQAEETQLFTSRGYGGYIDSERLAAIRKRKSEAESQTEIPA
jgi:hypothetical protein